MKPMTKETLMSAGLMRRHAKVVALVSFTIGMTMLLAGCMSNPIQSQSVGPAKAELQFLDLQGFDRDLSASLSEPLPKVEVAFYDRITPSSMPDRLQNWMAAVQGSGGSVKVIPPKDAVTPKSPLLLLTAISALWDASRTAREMSKQARFQASEAYDVEILLKQDEKQGNLVDKVVFTKRKAKGP